MTTMTTVNNNTSGLQIQKVSKQNKSKHEVANELLIAYRNETDEVEKQFILDTLVRKSMAFMNAYCKKISDVYAYHGEHIDVTDVQEIAYSTALEASLKNCDLSKSNFLTNWGTSTKRRVINEMKRRKNNANIGDTTAIQGNATKTNDDGQVREEFDSIHIERESDFEVSDLYASYRTIVEQEFSKVNKHWKVMLFFLLPDEMRYEEIRKYYGEEKYTNTIAKRVERVRTDFASFLVRKGYKEILFG